MAKIVIDFVAEDGLTGFPILPATFDNLDACLITSPQVMAEINRHVSNSTPAGMDAWVSLEPEDPDLYYQKAAANGEPAEMYAPGPGELVNLCVWGGRVGQVASPLFTGVIRVDGEVYDCVPD